MSKKTTKLKNKLKIISGGGSGNPMGGGGGFGNQ